MKADRLIKKAVKQIKKAGYKPFALYFSKTSSDFIITTDKYNPANYRLIKYF